MGNGDHSPVPWKYMQEHEEESSQRDLRINTLEVETRNIKTRVENMESDVKDFIDTSNKRHADNIKAIGDIKAAVAKIVGMGVGAWFVLTLLMDFLKSHP